VLDTAASPRLNASPDFDEVPVAVLAGKVSLARALDPQYGNARGHAVNLRIAQGRKDGCDPSSLLIPSEPSFASLHGHPDWRRLVRRLKRARLLQPT
jgi:hypothetical protein